MENKKVAIILINYKDYARKYLDECLFGLRKQDYAGAIKIFIVDNETSDRSFEFLKVRTPEAEIIRNNNNDGFAKGNNDAMKAAILENFSYIILFNMDTIIDPGCIKELVKIAESNDRIGAVQARIMLWPEKDLINSVGDSTHFLGFGFCEGYRERVESRNPKNPIGTSGPLLESKVESEIVYPSGAAVLYKAGALKEVGLFDEEFWMYNEDQDLGWRFWLGGYKNVLAWDAVVFHKYEFSKSIKKYYWMDRNRLLCAFKNYHWGTLVLIFPALIFMEFGLLLFAIRGGWLKEKIDIYKYFLNSKTWAYILKARKTSQSLRKIKEKDIVSMFSGKIWYQEIDDAKLRFVNPFFNLYWKIVKSFIWW